MYEYRCESCGCYLDPEEGRVCEECLSKERKKPKVMFGQFLVREDFGLNDSREDLG